MCAVVASAFVAMPAMICWFVEMLAPWHYICRTSDSSYSYRRCSYTGETELYLWGIRAESEVLGSGSSRRPWASAPAQLSAVRSLLQGMSAMFWLGLVACWAAQIATAVAHKGKWQPTQRGAKLVIAAAVVYVLFCLLKVVLLGGGVANAMKKDC